MEPSLVWTGPGSMALVLAISGHQYQVNNGLRRSPSQIVTLVIIPSLAARGWERGHPGLCQLNWPTCK